MDIMQYGDSSNHIMDSWRWLMLLNFDNSLSQVCFFLAENYKYPYKNREHQCDPYQARYSIPNCNFRLKRKLTRVSFGQLSFSTTSDKDRRYG